MNRIFDDSFTKYESWFTAKPFHLKAVEHVHYEEYIVVRVKDTLGNYPDIWVKVGVRYNDIDSEFAMDIFYKGSAICNRTKALIEFLMYYDGGWMLDHWMTCAEEHAMDVGALTEDEENGWGRWVFNPPSND